MVNILVTLAPPEAQATTDGYWKEFVNPVDKAQANLVAVGTATPGAVMYDAVNTTRYYIYGGDKQGAQIRDKGQPFVLGNS